MSDRLPEISAPQSEADSADLWLEENLEAVRRISEAVNEEYREKLERAHTLCRIYLQREMAHRVLERVSSIELPPEALS